MRKSAEADCDRFAGGDSVAIRWCRVSLWLRTRSDLPESTEVDRNGECEDGLVRGRAGLGGAAFTVEGAPIAEDVAVLGAGVSLDIADHARLGFDYSGQFGERAAEHSASARFSLRF